MDLHPEKVFSVRRNIQNQIISSRNKYFELVI
jgi:hypothetical protein